MKKIVFLDRDGVINKKLEADYVKSWDEFEFLPGVLDAIKLLNENGFKIIIISNQGGVSKGLLSLEDLNKINEKMCREIKNNGGEILKSYYCPHQDNDNCSCRKPKAGLFKMAMDEFDIDTKETWMIGDSERDIVAGKEVGCRGILVSKDNKVKTQAGYVAEGLFEAVKIIKIPQNVE